MPWYKTSLTEDEVTAGMHRQLQDRFGTLFLQAQAPKDAALFTPSALSFPQVMYFTPGADQIVAQLGDKYSIVECDAPDEACALLVGESDARKLLP